MTGRGYLLQEQEKEAAQTSVCAAFLMACQDPHFIKR